MKFILIFLIPFLLFSFLKKEKYFFQKNHPPVVKIIMPENKRSFQWNTAVRYKISVSDQEDGESRYQEISPKEVVLEVKYVPHLSDEKEDSIMKYIEMPSGLTAIESSNYFNCHRLNTKSAGPSFEEINKRYKHTEDNIELLAHRIKAGSSGIWGNESMPPHPTLTDKETTEIVKWIFAKAKDSLLSFYTGINGSFVIKKPDSSKTGSFMLTAHYTDHGTRDEPRQRLSGRDRVVIFAK